jgi:hypothetical protein
MLNKKMNRYNFIFIIIYIFTVSNIVNCNRTSTASLEKDYSEGMSEDELEIIKEILEKNNIENTIHNRNMIVMRSERHYDDTIIVTLPRIRLHEEILELPPSVSNLNDLEFIHIVGSDEKPDLPKGLEYFNNLDGIIIFDRTVDSSFNKVLFQLNPYHLVINDCKFKQFPNQIYNIKRLQFLSLRNDSLSVVSQDINKLTNLEVLILNGNNLVELPKTISDLDSVSRIYINENNFSTFPQELTKMVNLIELDISKNNISELPDEICNLSNLTPGMTHFDGEISGNRIDYNFRLYSNKICNPSSEVNSFLVKYAGENWSDNQICE